MATTHHSSLQKELEAVWKHGMEVLPEEVIGAFEQSISQLRDSGSAKGLSVGAAAPDFTLSNQTGSNVSLSAESAKGPVILTFYRGSWCPFCNLELKAYQHILAGIQEVGAQLLAVSPLTPDHSLTLREKHKLEFHVLSDSDNQVAERYQLKFSLPEELREIYRSLGFALEEYNGDDSWELPVPATYIIDKNGIIRFASVNPDYRTRAEPDEVLRFLHSL
ncbi:peroxiredoxin-like family protein [Paenibacillus nasutitermitis]|uniref:thioredoxin-dependent peroxiredoxin n=1 Tax=Paenibacillus nasutitermitis TaxID=1652958 RepID=A0A916ZAZ8_9BACL|nr:peroxiredoxin-like family protein [Paenibacillus nasutitermitis]GGD84037.1 alkyl hydroperoxide reductase [Paenibacillus nasutitermitis]